jgi:hypothetical protein
MGDPYPNFYSTAYAQLISTYKDLVNKVQTQNDQLDKQILQYNQDHSVDYKMSFYENQSIEYLKNIYMYLFYLYGFFVLILGFIFMFKGVFFKPYNITILITLLLFPFLIYPLEQFLYSIWIYIYSFLTDQAFSNIYLTHT